MTIPMIGNWNYPTRVWAGPGRVSELPKACEELGIVRPLVVTDSGLRDSAMIRKAMSLLPLAKLFADVRGNPVAANVEAGLKAYDAGAHAIPWDGRDDGGRRVPAGVYFVRFAADGMVETGKALLLP